MINLSDEEKTEAKNWIDCMSNDLFRRVNNENDHDVLIEELQNFLWLELNKVKYKYIKAK